MQLTEELFYFGFVFERVRVYNGRDSVMAGKGR